MKRIPRIACLAGLFWCFLSARAFASHVNLIELDNKLISPVTQQYIEQAVGRSENDGASCLILVLDTPGGLLESTRGIVKRLMNAKVPVVVYVAPSGSRAGSAGVFITLASHVAAMAPSTNIGAAHPVAMGGDSGPGKKLIRRVTRAIEEGDDTARKRKDGKSGPSQEEIVEEEERDPMSEKILNDTVAWVSAIAKARNRNEAWAKKAVTESFSITESEALKEHIIDLVARDVPDLLSQLNGRKVSLSEGEVTLDTANAEIIRMPLSRRQEFLATITHPNIAYLLMMFGVLGLIFEFTHPGLNIPGVAGLICILLALYSFQALPLNYTGVALAVLGIVLFIAELTIVSHGLLAIGGVIALTLGSLMLIESPDQSLHVSLQVILPVVGTFAALVLLVLQRAVRIWRKRPATGSQGLIGEIGFAATDLKPEGTVFVHGEHWSATASKPVKKGERIKIKRVEGLHIFVESADKGGS